MGVEIVHDPVETLGVGKGLGNMANVPTEIDRGPPSQDIADHLTGRHRQGRDQAACAMANVFEFAQSRLARACRLRWVLGFQSLDAGLFVGAQDLVPKVSLATTPPPF